MPRLDFDTLDAIGILAGQLMAKDFDPQRPICLCSLPDGQRFTIIRPPVTAQGTIAATIRIPSHARRTVDDDGFADMMAEVNAPDTRKTQRDQRLVDRRVIVQLRRGIRDSLLCILSRRALPHHVRETSDRDAARDHSCSGRSEHSFALVSVDCSRPGRILNAK